jgi:NAD(P)-dependent dehydrogenase (short-subunit alcohol dehydrogenase family)
MNTDDDHVAGQPVSGIRQGGGTVNDPRAGEAGRSDAAIWPGRFNDQVVLVTGAAGGLAAPTCRRIAAEGGTVVCTDVHLSGDGSSRDSCLRLDVTDRASWHSVVEAVVVEHGRLDGALLTHAISGPVAPVEHVASSDWARTTAVNLDGCFYGLSATVPVMKRAAYGRVVAVSSFGGLEGVPTRSAYSASKAALNTLVKVVAKECAAEFVTVNTIAQP